MKVLFITGRYGENASANGICVKNIIEKMSVDNEIFCMCYDDYSKKNITKEQIIKVKRGLLYKILYKFEKNKKLNKLIVNTLNVIKMFFLPIWPWVDPIYTIKLYLKAKRICKNEKIDVVIGVHMPISSLIVSSLLKKKNNNIKYVAYFLDSLSGGKPLSIMSREWNLKKKLKWEKMLLSNADKIIFMESSREHHDNYNKNQSFYKKVIYLDVPLFNDTIEETNDYFNNNKINISFCGTANFPLRNIPYILSILKRVKNKNIIFHFFGDCNYDELVNNKFENIKYHSKVSHKQVLEILSSSDMLLNLGTKEPSTISGKIFEYMSYGKPIISSYSIENESCIPYLKKYNNVFFINENDKNINKKAEELEKFVNENVGKRIECNKLKSLFYNTTPESFAKVIMEME